MDEQRSVLVLTWNGEMVHVHAKVTPLATIRDVKRELFASDFHLIPDLLRLKLNGLEVDDTAELSHLSRGSLSGGGPLKLSLHRAPRGFCIVLMSTTPNGLVPLHDSTLLPSEGLSHRSTVGELARAIARYLAHESDTGERPSDECTRSSSRRSTGASTTTTTTTSTPSTSSSLPLGFSHTSTATETTPHQGSSYQSKSFEVWTTVVGGGPPTLCSSELTLLVDACPSPISGEAAFVFDLRSVNGTSVVGRKRGRTSSEPDDASVEGDSVRRVKPRLDESEPVSAQQLAQWIESLENLKTSEREHGNTQSLSNIIEYLKAQKAGLPL